MCGRGKHRGVSTSPWWWRFRRSCQSQVAPRRIGNLRYSRAVQSIKLRSLLHASTHNLLMYQVPRQAVYLYRFKKNQEKKQRIAEHPRTVRARGLKEYYNKFIITSREKEGVPRVRISYHIRILLNVGTSPKRQKQVG